MATATTAPQTLLQAVNTLLQAVRVASVMSLDTDDLNTDASSAKDAIEEASREVQLRGYEFNTSYDYTLLPNPAGEVELPLNTLKVRAIRCKTRRLVKRGLKLYDNRKNTFTIGENVEVDLVSFLPFDDLPESFKLYVTGLAARRWCLPKMPSGSTFQYTEEMLKAALVLAEQEDAEGSDTVLTDTSPHFANMRRR
nr:hypothetical protein [uncultured Gellertiella sp.]